MSGDYTADERFDCPHCGERFARERHRDLHLGQAHADSLSSAEREAHEAAEAAEREELRLFRLKALAALVAVYFGFLMLYAFSL